MDFKDYYQTLGVARDATQDQVKSAYRKLARKFHPDVSQEADAEARFKEIGEAHEVLRDVEKRAAYDAAATQYERQKAAGGARGGGGSGGGGFEPPPGWDAGFEFRGRGGEPDEDLFSDGHSDFFEALFGRRAGAARTGGAPGGADGFRMPGRDHHAKVTIDLLDAYRGARRSLQLQMPEVGSDGRPALRERTLDVTIPKGIRAGQQLRLAGQGSPGLGGAPSGDLYLEIEFEPHARFRVDGRDVLVDLPLAPWEAALGAAVPVETPEGPLELTIPPGSAAGRKLRLKGRGLPGPTPGDLYAVLSIALPPATDADARAAYERFRDAVRFDPRGGH